MEPDQPVFRWVLDPPLHIARPLFKHCLAVLVFGLTVATGRHIAGLTVLHWGAEAATLNGIVLTFLIAFRNNAAYERWWEARTLWGRLVNESRNLALKAMAMVQPDVAERGELHRLISGFSTSLASHLHLSGTLQAVPGFEQEPNRPNHVPAHIAGRVHQLMSNWQRGGRIDTIQLASMEQQASALMDICGGCERIRSTPLASSYRALLRQGIFLQILLIMGLTVLDLGYVGVPVSLVPIYFMLGLEITAETIENPFGTAPDDLALDKLCVTIRDSCAEILGVE